MTYMPLRQLRASRSQGATTVFANLTEDLKDLPQMLDASKALKIDNYLVTINQGLEKRGGLRKVFDNSGINGGSMLLKFSTDYDIIGYANKISAFNNKTGLETNIKTYTSNSTYEGARADEYTFVTNKKEYMGRITCTLAYDAQTANFTVGALVTGGTSGATAIIAQDADGGATGTLTLKDVLGTFLDNELITDTAGGSADVNGVLTWTYTQVTNAPICQCMKLIGARLYLGVGSSVCYSSIDTGSNPPFNTWTVGTLAADPGKNSWRQAGTVNAIDSLGDSILALCDNGKWAFRITTTDSAGTLKKEDVFVMQRIDMGGARATAVTPAGLFYVNKGGLWNMVSVGQSNIAYNAQEIDPATLLGAKYFDDVDLTNADLIYLIKYDTLLLTCAKDSSVNNHIIAYNIRQKTFSRITGWNINRFCNDNQTIYGISALATKVYECLSGSTDDSADIWTDYYQELQTGGLEARKELIGQYMDAFLSPSGSLNVQFDIFDITGNFVENKLNFDMTVQGAVGKEFGYGVQGYGEGFAGQYDDSNMLECFDGGDNKIRNYQRIRVRIRAHDKFPHILVWLKLITNQKGNIRRRHLIQNT